MGSFSFNSQYLQKNDDSFTPAGSLGLSYAAFMLGIPSSMSSDNNASYALMNPYYAWYGQDTWRVTRNLTITLGLRVEYERAPTERYDRALTYFDPAAQLQKCRELTAQGYRPVSWSLARTTPERPPVAASVG